MAGLWRRRSESKEGKYPIVLRRDGSPVTSRYFVLLLKDPAAASALRAYADAAEKLGMDPKYVEDIRWLAEEAVTESAKAQTQAKKPDPDAPPHRADDLVTIAWARAIGCPGS